MQKKNSFIFLSSFNISTHEIPAYLFIGIILYRYFFSCHSQTTHTTTPQQPSQRPARPADWVGGPFENADFFYIGMPQQIGSADTSAGWNEAGQKLLITGTIYQPDGKTPAPGVILYYYHTDTRGYYANRPGLDAQIQRHGYLRGWVQSDAKGQYAIYTVRPAPYPGETMPAHIHPAILEERIGYPYYIDEFVFDDDPLLTAQERQKLLNRGGSGVMRLWQQDSLQVAEHDIILGLHIPNYPDF